MPFTERTLDDLARLGVRAIRRDLDPGEPPADSPAPAGANTPGASFVTLRQAGRLRGCIGSLEPRRALAEDVAANACAAAFRDPRFPPLVADELARTDLEVSVLSAREPVAFADEATLIDALRPGTDGVVLAHGSRRATYLPGVWEQLPDPRRFLSELRRKAGIAPQVPYGELAAWRYTTTHSNPVPLAADA